MSELDFSGSGGANIKIGGESGTCGRCADLQAQVEKLIGLLPRLKRYLYPEAYGWKVLIEDRLKLAEDIDAALCGVESLVGD